MSAPVLPMAMRGRKASISAPTSAIPPSLAMKADEARAILEQWNLDLV